MLGFLGVIAVFTAGINAIQKGEIAWSRTKTITGQPAKRIGVALIVVSVILGLVLTSFIVMNQIVQDDYSATRTSTTWPN